jgi:hypothetical protein
VSFSTGSRETSREGILLADIAEQPYADDVVAAPRKGGDSAPRFVRRAVVHENVFVRIDSEQRQHIVDCGDEWDDQRFLVQEADDDRELRLSRAMVGRHHARLQPDV